MENFADLGIADDILLEGRLEHAHHRLADIVEGVVDDIIGADIDIFPNRKILDLGGRPDVKTDDDGLRGGRQEDIGLGDGTGPLVQDLDFDYPWWTALRRPWRRPRGSPEHRRE